MTEHDEIKKYRDLIDEVDVQIQDLLNERVRIAQQIARLKSSDDNGDYYRPEREAQVLRKVMDRNQGPLPNHTMATLFREIMSAALAAEAPIRVRYLGPEGTYSHAAVLKHFGKSVETMDSASLDDVFRTVEKGEADYGVVPVENSIEGVVTHTLDKFLDSPLKISGEVNLRIRHQLLSNVSEPDKVQAVYAHNQSLAQCRGWLSTHLPTVKLEAVSSNAEVNQPSAPAPGPWL